MMFSETNIFNKVHRNNDGLTEMHSQAPLADEAAGYAYTMYLTNDVTLLFYLSALEHE
jgi:hypothetical protein